MEEFIVIMNAISEHENKGSKKGRREEAKKKYGANARG